MGGGYYDRDMESAPVGGGGHSDVANQALSQTTSLHKSMDPKRWASEPLKC